MPSPADRLRELSAFTRDNADSLELHRLAKEADRLTARHAAAVSLLKRLEWIPFGDIGVRVCPVCDQEKPDEPPRKGHDCGHEPDCELAAAVGGQGEAKQNNPPP